MTELPNPSRHAEPFHLRQRIREGAHTAPTIGLAPGYVHCNLVMVPRGYASEFAGFCGANAAACPVIAMSEPGSTGMQELGENIDLRTDAGSYRVFERGQAVTDVLTLERVWQGDLVTFALGSADSLDGLLARHNLAPGYRTRGDVRAHYITARDAAPYGDFRGRLAVSMRPIPETEIDAVTDLTGAHPKLHGAPIQLGDPSSIGIESLGVSVARHGLARIEDGEVAIFWPSGLTAHLALAAAKMPLCITNTPGHLLIADLPLESVCEDAISADPPPRARAEPLDDGMEDPVAPTAGEQSPDSDDTLVLTSIVPESEGPDGPEPGGQLFGGR